jgi:glycosyltransferase involved in cell wall biosynthesis
MSKSFQISIFEYIVTKTNPIGSCHLRMLSGLLSDWKATVFAVEFENPDSSRVEFVRIPAIKRPLFLLFLTYHLLHPLFYLFYKIRTGKKFDIIQTVEGNSFLGNVRYPHFCHKAFLAERWRQSRSPMLIRRAASYLNHKFHAICEEVIYRLSSTKAVVVPSSGLAKELEKYFGRCLRGKIFVIPNPIDYARYEKPNGFDREAFRSQLGLSRDDIVVIFTAVTQFERKGFPFILEALRQNHSQDIKLLVVGGNKGRVKYYSQQARALGIDSSVRFVGQVEDVRPYLWSADIFVFPSWYEVFSLATLEALAAGLVLVVSPVHGVTDYIVDGKNGILVDHDAESIARALKLLGSDSALRKSLSIAARETARQFDVKHFQNRWIKFYQDFLAIEKG